MINCIVGLFRGSNGAPLQPAEVVLCRGTADVFGEQLTINDLVKLYHTNTSFREVLRPLIQRHFKEKLRQEYAAEYNQLSSRMQSCHFHDLPEREVDWFQAYHNTVYRIKFMREIPDLYPSYAGLFNEKDDWPSLYKSVSGIRGCTKEIDESLGGIIMTICCTVGIIFMGGLVTVAPSNPSVHSWSFPRGPVGNFR